MKLTKYDWTPSHGDGRRHTCFFVQCGPDGVELNVPHSPDYPRARIAYMLRDARRRLHNYTATRKHRERIAELTKGKRS